MLNINIDHHTNLDELDLIGNFLKELSKLRASKQLQLVEANPETTKAPKKTKAQPVTLTTAEAGAPLTETPTETVVAAPAAAAEPEPAQYTDGGLEPAAAEESSPAESPLDIVAVRAVLGPILKDKKDELTALIKEYGESLPKIDPAHYPEIVAKAKEL